jgi:alpha-galactosidase
MMGKLGFDIEVDKMTENELKFSQNAVINYNTIKDVIYTGDLFRLVSPYEENRAVLMYVNEAKNRAILFGYNLNTRYGETMNRVKLQGLDPNKTYKIQEINVSNEGRRGPGMGMGFGMSESGRSYTGDYLMKAGLNVGTGTPLTSVIYEIAE